MDDREQKIEDWFREQMTNSIVSQNTPVYNHVRKAVDDLKDRLGIKKSADSAN